MLVQPPHQRREPGEAALDEHDAQSGEPLEDPFADEAHHVCLERLCHVGVVLDVVRRPARGGDGDAAGAAPEVDADRKAMAYGGFVDLPVLAPPERLGRPHDQQHLDETRVVGEPVDLLDGEVGVLVRHRDTGAQAGFLLQPLGDLPLVGGLAQCRGVLRVELGAARAEAVQDAVLDALRIQVLLAHELQVATRWSARRRPGIVAGGRRTSLGIQRSGVGTRAEELTMLAPARGQVGVERSRPGRVVDVAVDHHAAISSGGRDHDVSSLVPVRLSERVALLQNV